VLANGLVQVNVNPYFEQVAIGLALGAAAGLDKLYQHLERLKVPVEADPALAAAAPAEGGAE